MASLPIAYTIVWSYRENGRKMRSEGERSIHAKKQKSQGRGMGMYDIEAVYTHTNPGKFPLGERLISSDIDYYTDIPRPLPPLCITTSNVAREETEAILPCRPRLTYMLYVYTAS
jgi:hypothetical protein